MIAMAHRAGGPACRAWLVAPLPPLARPVAACRMPLDLTHLWDLLPLPAARHVPAIGGKHIITLPPPQPRCSAFTDWAT